MSSNWVALLVLNSTRPPIPSESCDGTKDLYTSIESMRSVGRPSNKTFLPPSGAGINAPFIDTAFRSPDIPLNVMYLPSP